mmetsp:Transcript_24706/g.36225  ORF Transcript_24706/g.36225 Transcript_24706/m.36225 type:complete len:387 (-) Transcript_24706:28-1188(-)
MITRRRHCLLLSYMLIALHHRSLLVQSFNTIHKFHSLKSKRSIMSSLNVVNGVNGEAVVNGINGSHETIRKEMTSGEKYLFDLNGYIIVKNVLNKSEIQSANEAINQHEHEMIQRSIPELRNAKKGTKMYGSGPSRKDLGGILEWPNDESNVFKSILAHSKLLPYYHTLLGKGYRMDHLPFLIAQDVGAEGFQLHGGTVDCESGRYNPHLAYNCFRDTLHCALLGVNVFLSDVNPGDGGFCIVPGSHKSNFAMPMEMIHGEAYNEFIVQPTIEAGDVVLFSEGTVHGSLPWNNPTTQRRSALYRFAPATNAYGRSYFRHEEEDGLCRWPEAMYENLTDAQRAVLEPPYANRLDRPNIDEDGETVEITTRNEKKKEHDQQVFKTKYF